MEAFILINTKSGWLWKVAQEIAKIKGVKLARAVTGQFDVATYIKLERNEDLSNIIEKLQSINGIVKTQTLIAMPPSAYTLSS